MKTRPITTDDPPQFPCWVWFPPDKAWTHVSRPTQLLAEDTHWLPDQPTPPTVRPEDMTDTEGWMNIIRDMGREQRGEQPAHCASREGAQWAYDAAREIIEEHEITEYVPYSRGPIGGYAGSYQPVPPNRIASLILKHAPKI